VPVTAAGHNFIAARPICRAAGWRRVRRVGLTADGGPRLDKLAPTHLDELRHLAPVRDRLVAGWAARDRDACR
jgi:hypothetical protein